MCSARSSQRDVAIVHSPQEPSDVAPDRESRAGRHGPGQKRAATERSARGLRNASNVHWSPWQLQARSVLLITRGPSSPRGLALRWRETEMHIP
jgi:hypothetical protein